MPMPMDPPAQRQSARPPIQYAAAGWEQKIDKVLTSQLNVREQAQQLRAVFHSLPPEGRAEAAAHMANLTEDEDYGLGSLLTDPETPEEALQVLLIDLSSRPESVRLPLLLDLMRASNHPLQQEAKEELSFLLDEDYGNDWASWETAVRRALEP